MIKSRYILSGATFLLLTFGFAQLANGKLSLGDACYLEALKEEMSSNLSRGSSTPNYIPGFIKLEPGQSINTIESKGVEILNKIGDIYIVNMPVDSVISISESKGLIGLQLSRIAKPMMNKARLVGDVDQVQSGEGLTVNHGFDGSGIFTAIFDTGVEPNNPNFNNQVEVVFNYDGNNVSNPTPTEYYGSDVKNFTTDNDNSTHGTHVLGIMGGRGKDIDKYYEYTIENGNVYMGNYTNTTNPFYGVATGSRLGVGCTQTLYNAYIIDGVARLIEYGESKNLPIVINLSLGDNMGPHDATSYTAAALSELSNRANIFVAAGNEAEADIALTRTFSSDGTLKTFLVPSGYSNNNQPNYSFSASNPLDVEIWGKNNEILDVNLTFVASNGLVRRRIPITNKAQSISLNTELPSDFTAGRITLQYDIDETNNRYNAIIYCTNISQAKSSNVFMTIEVNGKAGQRVDLFSTGSVTFSSLNKNGYTSPDGNMSISNMACGNGYAVVGASISRGYIPAMDGQLYWMGERYAEVGNIAPFSSFGALANGKSLPNFVTPGSLIISSLSSYYTSRMSETNLLTQTSGVLEQNNRNYYWGYEMGTSMASPFAAGVAALWQQANIEKNGKVLSTAEIIDIAQKNIIQNEYFNLGDKTQWGAGILNAIGGIKYILTGVTATGKVYVDNPDNDTSFILTLRGKEMNVFVAGASAMDIELITLTGQKLLERKIDNNDYTQNLDYLSNGIYLLKVITPEGGHYTRKISIR